jgi:hypothetical protein
MTAGHFGFAAGAKAAAPRVPLWALMLATYALDIVFIALVAAGVESFSSIDPAHPAYGQVVINALYDHSLVGALVISAVAGGLALWRWGRDAGIVIAAVAFSHWVLDLIVHRPDMPILPGNMGNLPLLGFGLWDFPTASIILELALVLGGTYLYYTAALNSPAAKASAAGRQRALLAVGVTGVLLLLLLASDALGLNFAFSLMLMLLLVVLSGWLDARLGWR